MLKKLMLIGILCFSVMVLLPTQATAWNFGGGGWGWGTYSAIYDIRGGQKPGTFTTFVASEINVQDAALVCVNPGSKKRDVRVGKGGITLYITSSENEFQYDERGRYTLEQQICSTVGDFIEIPGQDPIECTQSRFEQTWGVDFEDCRNDNWTPYEFLVKNLILTGRIWTNCTNVNDIPGSCDEVAADEISLYCETDENYRRWADDDIVLYTCEETEMPY